MKILLILLFPTLVMAQTEIEDAKRSVKSLIEPLLATGTTKRPKGTEDFRVDGCEKKKINWMNVLLMRERPKLDFKFKKNCDIQGVVEPMVLRPFPADLELRNLRSYKNLKTKNKITADLQEKPILNLTITEGLLSGPKSTVKFEADYKVQVNPISQKPVEKNLGGEIRIYEINGKKTDIKEKILVQ